MAYPNRKATSVYVALLLTSWTVVTVARSCFRGLRMLRLWGGRVVRRVVRACRVPPGPVRPVRARGDGMAGCACRMVLGDVSSADVGAPVPCLLRAVPRVCLIPLLLSRLVTTAIVLTIFALVFAKFLALTGYSLPQVAYRVLQTLHS